MRLLIVGAGAVGGTMAVRLVQAGHDVEVVARGAHLDAIRSGGLRLRTPADDVTVALPAVGSASQARPADVVVLATKGQDTAAVVGELVATTLRTAPLVCAQNGVENEEVARRSLPHVLGMLVMMPAAHLRPGEVQASSSPVTGLLDVGCWPEGTDDTTDVLAGALGRAGFDSRSVPDISRWKHAKLLMNLGNAVVALCGEKGRGSGLSERARAEGRAVLDRAGIHWASDAEDAARRGDLLRVGDVGDGRRPGNSTWQSLARGTGSTEVDQLNGVVVRLGERTGVPTPVNALLQRLVTEAARDGAAPGSMSPDEVLALLG